jgi:hypothetical protein
VQWHYNLQLFDMGIFDVAPEFTLLARVSPFECRRVNTWKEDRECRIGQSKLEEIVIVQMPAHE